jgi:hypothetical protein
MWLQRESCHLRKISSNGVVFKCNYLQVQKIETSQALMATNISSTFGSTIYRYSYGGSFKLPKLKLIRDKQEGERLYNYYCFNDGKVFL